MKTHRLTIIGKENLDRFLSVAGLDSKFYFDNNEGYFDLDEFELCFSFDTKGISNFIEGLVLAGEGNYYFSSYEDEDE